MVDDGVEVGGQERRIGGTGGAEADDAGDGRRGDGGGQSGEPSPAGRDGRGVRAVRGVHGDDRSSSERCRPGGEHLTLRRDAGVTADGTAYLPPVRTLSNSVQHVAEEVLRGSGHLADALSPLLVGGGRRGRRAAMPRAGAGGARARRDLGARAPLVARPGPGRVAAATGAGARSIPTARWPAGSAVRLAAEHAYLDGDPAPCSSRARRGPSAGDPVAPGRGAVARPPLPARPAPRRRCAWRWPTS